MFQKYEIQGKMVKDPKFMTAKSGLEVAVIRVAVNSNFRRNGYVVKESLYWNCFCFGEAVELIKRADMKKGSIARVTGRIQKREFMSDGVRKEVFQIIAQSVAYVANAEADIVIEEVPDEITELVEF